MFDCIKYETSFMLKIFSFFSILPTPSFFQFARNKMKGCFCFWALRKPQRLHRKLYKIIINLYFCLLKGTRKKYRILKHNIKSIVNAFLCLIVSKGSFRQKFCYNLKCKKVWSLVEVKLVNLFLNRIFNTLIPKEFK